MRAVIVYDREFEIVVERRGRYRLPLRERSEAHPFDLSVIQIKIAESNWGWFLRSRFRGLRVRLDQ